MKQYDLRSVGRTGKKHEYKIYIDRNCSVSGSPFVIFNGKRQMPEMLVKLGRVLPATIMAVLIVYCLKGAVSAPVATGIPSLVGVLVTGGTYKWKHNTLLSILLGTASYMIMLRIM